MTKKYETQLAEVCSELNREEANYVLVGAMAMQLWGSTRATRDVDVLIEANVPNAQRVLRALGRVGFGLAKEWFAEEVASKPASIIGDIPRVDVLTVAWSVRYPEAADAATVFEVEGLADPDRLDRASHSIEADRPPTGRGRYRNTRRDSQTAG